MLEDLKKLRDRALAEFKKATDPEALFRIEKKYLGRQGELAKLVRQVKDLAEDQRPAVGQLVNEVKGALIEALNEVRSAVLGDQGNKRDQVNIDPTLPGRKLRTGKLHPMTQLLNDMIDIFRSLGFGVVDGPEVESEWYNFTALNIPEWHPSRDIQDTFYIKSKIQNPKSKTNPKSQITNSKQDNKLVLRTHTSPVQIRALEKYGAPLSIIAPGRVYRDEETDATHEATFWQVEGLMVDENISVAHLKGVMDHVIERLISNGHSELVSESNLKGSRNKFGMTPKGATRWRPGYFPFTEPSLEMDIGCLFCKGKGCRVCKHTGWLEFMGSGLVHPNVIKAGGLDPKKWQGFAFGLGLERLHMLKYGVDDIRLYKSGDLRFLEQF